jgi:hypothetical protein
MLCVEFSDGLSPSIVYSAAVSHETATERYVALPRDGPLTVDCVSWARKPTAGTPNINNDLAGSGSAFDCSMSLPDRVEIETAWVEARHDLASFHQLCGFAQNLTVMRASLSGQYRQQREYTGVTRCAKGQRRQRVGTLAERADDMSEASDRVKRRIEHGSAHGVVDEIEAPTGRTRGDIFVERRFPVDECCANPLDICLVLG